MTEPTEDQEQPQPRDDGLGHHHIPADVMARAVDEAVAEHGVSEGTARERERNQ